MTTKQTLQLRHQLSCSGITIQAATYDATRHHVLAYDSNALAPHTLRLFSLRREIKSVKLFDEVNPAPVPPQKTTQSAVDTKKSTKNSSSSGSKDAALVPIVHSLSLEYSQTTDVYICVYTAQSIPLSRAKSKRRLSDQEESQAVYNVLFLEPASLKKLVNYPGPISHQLRCVFFDESSDRLVLAVHRNSSESSCSNNLNNSSGVFSVNRSRQLHSEFASTGGEGSGELDSEGHDAVETERVALAEGGPMYNHIDILQISKRELKASRRNSQSIATNGSAEVKDEETPLERTVLCIEKTGPSLLHSETISLVCGSKRLTRLFGVGYVSVGGGSSAGVESFLVEWRESAEQHLELIRRVMLHDPITALTLSSCSSWLFTGHESGALRAWNVSTVLGSKKRARSYGLGASPLESELSTWHGHSVTSLRLSMINSSGTVQSEDRDQYPPTEAMVVTADRDSGVTKHWRFQAGSQPQSSPSESQGESTDSGDLVAKIDLVGSYTCDSQLVSGKQSKSAIKKKTLLDSALCTVPIFVCIDMDGFTENLLLILRDDVIHVLKVQTVMHVLQETRSGDEISTFRIAGHPSTPKLVVLSGNHFSSVQILTLDASYTRTGEVCFLNQLIPPASQRSTSISAMEIYQMDQERSFVVFGWTCGSVDIHSLDTKNRVGILQDPHLNAHITAVGVVIHVDSHEPRASNQKPAPVSSSEPMRSWGGLLKFSVTKPSDHDDFETVSSSPAVDAQHHRSAVYIFAGTEHGQIFGWKVPASFDASVSSSSGRLMLESKIRVDSAHSAHVVQFARLREQQASGIERLVSLGADGMVKIWEVPSLSIVGYVNTATERHMSMPSCMGIIDGDAGDKNQFLAVGFEDGMLAVWKLDPLNVPIAELNVASHHERRVTSISASKRPQSAIQSGSIPVGEFLSCSLDMTAIVWSIREDCVDEKRYFDIGAPVVDMCTVRNVAVAALANEICAFEYCLGAPPSHSELSKRSEFEQLGVLSSTDEEYHLYQQSLRPDTPTTHSDGEAENESSSPTETPERVVNVLRVPTSLSQPDDTITIPSALTTSSKFTTKPATGQENPENAVRGRKKKTTGRQEATKIHGDELCNLLQEYIESHGTNGAMSAEYLTHFLANQRLTIIKRPDFAIRKYFQEQKMDLKMRLSVYDASEILLAIQSTPETRKGRFDKQQLGPGSQAQQKQQSQKPMMNRKAVVSFNILGEKSIRWEVCDPVKETEPTKRKEPSRGGVQSRDAIPASKSPTSASIRVPTDQSMSPPKELPARTPESEKPATVSNVFTGFADDDDNPGERQVSRKRRNRKPSVAQSIKSKTPKELPDHDLIRRLKLSHCFRQHWSRGYCWCSPCSELRVIWDDGATDESAKCSACNKKSHSLTLKKQGYKPYFSLRMVLGVIVEVYNELLIPSHSLLFKSAYKDSKDSQSSEAFSIHSTLYRVFTNKFGMQKVVEDKIKLFLVSATHYIREIDAIAVFGELLAMFARDDSSSDSHVPNEMVALCVSSYSWFFSRAMVINGELIIGSGHDPGYNSKQDTAMEIENGKRTHWQFVNLQNALLCAQEMLMYPLVSPGYLRNIVMYTGEYAQAYPTKPQAAGEIDEYAGDPSRSRQATQWIEIHRFLRLLVGEWKQQHNEFRVAEQTLFTQPFISTTQSSPSTDLRAEVIEKLRLILSCFIFYDHEREGVMAIDDFSSILRKLRYLWPNENVTAEEAEAIAAGEVSLTFENTILAARRRFADVEGDGLICYLDFWAMLYIVGVRTLTLLKFREIPSFCRDYKLEISADLHELLLCYMQRSSTMMLPRGFQLGKSSLDQRAAIQHQRRVGGLHDGVFRMPKALSNSLSLQELLSTNKQMDPKDQIYLEGSAPALGQSASVSAMDRFRPLTRDSSDSKGQQMVGVAPVVVGVRHIGAREKPRAFLSVSAISNDTLPDKDIRGQRSGNMAPVLQVECPLKYGANGVMDATGDTTSAFSNTYIQFPFVSPQQSRFEIPSKQTANAENRIVGQIPLSSAVDDGSSDGAALSWQSEILKEHEDEERAIAAQLRPVIQQHINALEPATHEAKHSPTYPVLRRSDTSKTRKSSRLVTSPLEASTEPPEAPQPKAAPSDVPAVAEPVKRKKRATVVVIPKIEKDTVKPQIPVTSGVPSETLKHRYPARENKPKSIENVLVDTKAATVVELTPRKPLTPEPWESVTNNRDEGAVGKDEAAQPEQIPEAVVADPSPRRQEVTPSPEAVVSVFDKTQLPSSDETTHADIAEDSDGAEARGGDGEDSGDDETDENVGDQEDTDNEESQDDSIGPTPREVVASWNVDLPVAVQEYVIVVEPQAVTSRQTVSSPPAAAVEIYIAKPQKPPITSAPDAHSLISAPVTLESPANETVLQSLNSDDSILPRRESVGVAVAEEVAQEKLRQEPEPAKVSESQQAPVEAPALRGDGLVSHHSFRFSQQPAFRSNAPVWNNPFRSGQWDPGNDSDSDEERRASEAAGAALGEGECEEEGDGERPEDIELQLTPEALEAYRETFRPHLRRSGVNGSLRPSLRHFGLAAAAANHMGNAPYKRSVSRDSTNPGISRRNTRGLVAAARNSDNDRALYGGKDSTRLGEGIVLSAEAEAQMQQKWLAFFSNAEEAMFSPLKHEIEDREEAQRLQEELQSHLMKKRQDQQAQDTLRLQQSRRESAVLKVSAGLGSADKTQASGAGADSANFRLRRMARESCQEVQNELRFGVSVQGEFAKAHEAQFFFEYDPNAHGSILTLRLNVHRGEAEVFMSTETKVPCVSDFMWRSVEKCKGLKEGNGQKLVLYAHDLSKVVASATVDSARDGLDTTGLVIPFFISVVAVEPGTTFALSIMASGQKTESSRAIKMVDTLIEQFNELSKSFEGRKAPSFDVASLGVSSSVKKAQPSWDEENSQGSEKSVSMMQRLDDGDNGLTSGYRVGGFLDRVESRRRQSALVGQDSHLNMNEEDSDTINHGNEPDGSREDQIDDADSDESESELGDLRGDFQSFQHLLESIGEKRGFGTPRSKSFFLSGPTNDQFEFIQDEETNLLEAASQYSPERLSKATIPTNADIVGSSAQDAIDAVLGERRLSMSSLLLKHHARRASVRKRVAQRLSPLKVAGNGAVPTGPSLPTSSTPSVTTLRVAKFAPKPVAYSLSSLDRDAHHLHSSKSSVTLQPPPRRADLPQVHSTSSLR
ncbi:hypothetical protein Gpo141_00002240 [Globisporangium polare]